MLLSQQPGEADAISTVLPVVQKRILSPTGTKEAQGHRLGEPGSPQPCHHLLGPWGVLSRAPEAGSILVSMALSKLRPQSMSGGRVRSGA